MFKVFKKKFGIKSKNTQKTPDIPFNEQLGIRQINKSLKSKKSLNDPFNSQLGIRQINRETNEQKFSYNITNNIGVKIVSILEKIISKYYKNNDNLHIVTDSLLKFVQNNSKIINNTLKNKYLYCLTLDLILKIVSICSILLNENNENVIESLKMIGRFIDNQNYYKYSLNISNITTNTKINILNNCFECLSFLNKILSRFLQEGLVNISIIEERSIIFILNAKILIIDHTYNIQLPFIEKFIKFIRYIDKVNIEQISNIDYKINAIIAIISNIININIYYINKNKNLNIIEQNYYLDNIKYSINFWYTLLYIYNTQKDINDNDFFDEIIKISTLNDLFKFIDRNNSKLYDLNKYIIKGTIDLNHLISNINTLNSLKLEQYEHTSIHNYFNGGINKNNYKKTENQITVIYNKKKYTRNIYINERKKYVKINKTYMLLSKLKKAKI
jgi:hypothetical protein